MLHYIWKYQKFKTLLLQTIDGQDVLIQSVGISNTHAGPDFFNARVTIGSQQWAGNVEIHIKSGDWYAHHHEKDTAYDNVILHVVWKHDVDVFRKDETVIPTLELQDIVDPIILRNYTDLMGFSSKKWINCDTQVQEVSEFLINNWKERLYFERLEQKSEQIFQLLESSHNDWEAVLFQLLAKNFGLVVNGDAFLSLAMSLDFSTIRKCANDIEQLEALFFGQAGLLIESVEEPYFKKLQSVYEYQKHKYKLDASGIVPMQFFRLRPPNFPTIRLSQLANLYYKCHQLFMELMELKTIADFYDVFDVSTSVFWETHYTFQKATTKRKKKLTSSFIDLLLINTIIPLRFCYAKHLGKNTEDAVLPFITAVKAEKNNIIQKFSSMGIPSASAMHTQALIHLKKQYCDKNLCVQCAIGNQLLSQNQK